jgi:hypothetical protein
MILSIFLPVKYILFSAGIWFILILFNCILGFNNGFDCWFNVLEFRLGNCNNYTAVDELNIPKHMKNGVVKTVYFTAISILLYKIYLFNK